MLPGLTIRSKSSAPIAPQSRAVGVVGDGRRLVVADEASPRIRAECTKLLNLFGTGMSIDEELRWHWVAGIVARYVWDDDRWDVLSDRHVGLAPVSAR